MLLFFHCHVVLNTLFGVYNVWTCILLPDQTALSSYA